MRVRDPAKVLLQYGTLTPSITFSRIPVESAALYYMMLDQPGYLDPRGALRFTRA